jgi:hypothetical protein
VVWKTFVSPSAMIVPSGMTRSSVLCAPGALSRLGIRDRVVALNRG